MTTSVILVRHGQTDSNINGFYMGQSAEDLNEVGYTQVRHLSSRLAGLPVASVYTSPLRRTYATAAILAETRKLEPMVLEDLVEIDLGDWQGLHMDEIKQGWPELWQRWRMDPSGVTVPNGESLSQVTERALRAFHSIAEKDKDKQSIIATHEAIVKVIVAYVLGAPNSIYRRFEVSNASLSMVRIINNRFHLTKLNDTSHLKD